MTTIAWDGKTLAADRRVNAQGIFDGNMRKVHKRKDGALCGGAGAASLVAAFTRWFMAGGKGKLPERKNGEQNASCFTIMPSGKITTYDEVGWFEVETKMFAVGSGWEIALGAMYSGKTAEEAVRIAAKLDGGTGNELDVLELGK